MRLLFALVVGYAAAQTAEAPPHIDYEVNLKHTEDVPAEKIVGVFGEIGVQAEAAEYVLAKLKERGEGVVAQCPKAACEKVAKAFTDIGLDAGKIRRRMSMAAQRGAMVNKSLDRAAATSLLQQEPNQRL